MGVRSRQDYKAINLPPSWPVESSKFVHSGVSDVELALAMLKRRIGVSGQPLHPCLTETGAVDHHETANACVLHTAPQAPEVPPLIRAVDAAIPHRSPCSLLPHRDSIGDSAVLCETAVNLSCDPGGIVGLTF